MIELQTLKWFGAGVTRPNHPVKNAFADVTAEFFIK